MLTIREEQMEALAEVQQERFLKEVLAFAEETWPEELQSLGEDGVREMAADAIDRCRAFGIETEYHVLRFINIMFALGEDFDDGEDYPWSVDILEDESTDPDDKLDKLEAETERALAES